MQNYLYTEIPDVIFGSGIRDCKQLFSVKRIHLSISVLRDKHFLAHLAKAKWAFSITWYPSSVVRRPSSVNFSHVNILFWNHLNWIELKLDIKHQSKVHYKDCSFFHNPLSNMAAIGNSLFWLFNLLVLNFLLKWTETC